MICWKMRPNMIFLTNTCNRRGLAEDFGKQLEAYGAEVHPISFIIGDIDEFKQFNDTYGHTAGDKVLVEIAKLMKSTVGEARHSLPLGRGRIRYSAV